LPIVEQSSAIQPAVEREEVFLDDRMLAVRHAPGPEGAPAMLFVHGLGGSSLNWTDLMLAFSDMDCWAVDLHGFGASPPARDGDMTPAGHARAVADFIEHQGIGPVHLVGNSLGGAVALQLAARRPDLVRSLTLISPALPGFRATRGNVHLPVIAIPGVGERLIAKFQEQASAEARVKATIDACFADARRMPSQRWDEAVEETARRDGLPYANDAFLRSLRGLLATYLDVGPDRPWRLAERVQCPTVVIYGVKDPLVDPRAAHRVTRHFKDAHVMVLPDSGHVSQMEHPEKVEAVMRRFLPLQARGQSPAPSRAESPA
jgi:pimeloyl-ACP methyl ester carboxylesterase